MFTATPLLYLTHHMHTHHAQVCESVFGSKLREIVDVRATHDFAAFLRGYRPRSADKHIRKQFAYTFEARDECVFVRTKQYCAAETPWGPWAQILPFPGVAPTAVHEPSVCPPVSAPKPWPELQADIARKLQQFYEKEFIHPVAIDAHDVEDMSPLHITHTHAHIQLATCTHTPSPLCVCL